jgi:tRNA-2-methylthio-N6-dimethylallyladenosine synthase
LPTAMVDAAEMARQQYYLEQVGQCQAAHRNETGFTRKYFLMTFGCQLNENDSEKIAGLLDQMGYLQAEEIREADFILFNTCSIRENADDRLFGNLGRVKNLRRDKPDLVIALCGCMMMQESHVEKVKKSYSFVDIIFGPQDIHRLPELLYHRLNDSRRVYEVGGEDWLAEGLPIRRARRFRALISIMYGCNNFCTYCVVPYTRGRERSRLPGDVLAELRDVAQSGYPEVLLLGQNVNSYGQDLHRTATAVEPADFAGLLESAAQIGGLRRIRFMTSHPKDISDRLLEVMAAHPNIETHLHLPLQSGSDRILALMNRLYTSRHFAEVARKARQRIPGLSISTDLIVGFPGETEEDFQATLDLMQAIRFDAAFTFQYSRRAGTPAAAMADQVPPDVVKDRFGRLIDLQNRHCLESNQQQVGRSVDVLIEGTSDTADDILTGRTLDNRLVNFIIPSSVLLPADLINSQGLPDGDALEGRFAQIRLTRAKTFSLEGEMESLQP